MASGKNVRTFAVPSLRPLVMHLFTRSVGRPSEDLGPHREVKTNNIIFYIILCPICINKIMMQFILHVIVTFVSFSECF